MSLAHGLGAVVVGALFVPTLAFAQETAPDAPSSGTSSAADPAPPVADRPAEPSKPTESSEERWRAILDAVFGFGATPVVSQRIAGPLITEERRSAESARFATSSINLGLAYDIRKELQAAAMLPIGFGYLSPDNSAFPNETRGSTILGNFTLGAAYKIRPTKNISVFGRLDVALPTASGDQLPDAARVSTLGHIDQKQFDRRSLLQAMTDSRGREDTASFASNHLGLVPKVAVAWTGMEKVEVDGYVKYQSLHATASQASYEGSFVVAARGSYRFHGNADATLRAWTNLPTAGADSAVAALEPQLRGHFGSFHPMVGVILPFAGELTNPYAIGVRATLAAQF